MSIVDPPKGIVTKQMLVPKENIFVGAQPGSAIVVHKTGGGDGTAEGTAFYFQHETNKSAHFVIGQDGTVVQCVHLADGAGANCSPTKRITPGGTLSSVVILISICVLSALNIATLVEIIRRL